MRGEISRQIEPQIKIAKDIYHGNYEGWRGISPADELKKVEEALELLLGIRSRVVDARLMDYATRVSDLVNRLYEKRDRLQDEIHQDELNKMALAAEGFIKKKKTLPSCLYYRSKGIHVFEFYG